ncbi:CDP-diacylglycerol--serine O-phosphatidyltransferase [Nicoletella semolina]|uniref:CDP-diacylglycerol--serine O-phosphatidyltransferase n=1 Tax=Nicoletella semolina TaxID=271160 RepID=A0A4R2N4F0_9PAST|nr:CDP-diacylglycerol--serine O-phosphatidyltransferase [Nicoletella semolina]MDH2925074.1 phosphatidylserine synthase [Nicoletella semolina]TCP15410.1 CDP-diacylglycerol--serine O-phosphatidyltransferase [Nicoletella semolina]
MLILGKQHRAKKYLKKLCYIPQEAEKINFLSNSRAFKDRILQLIENAKKRIYLTALYFEKDEAGQEILDALYKVKQEKPNLEIAILVDWHRAQRGRIGEKSSLSNADWYTQFRQQYALPTDNDIAVYGVPINGRELFGVLHLKGFIFDDTVLYSGASINNIYLQQFDRYRYDRYQEIENPVMAESMVQLLKQIVIANPAVNRLDQPKPKTSDIRLFIRAFRRQLMQETYRFQGQEQSESLSLLPILGLGRKNRLNKTIEALFYQVHNKLTICTPYFNFPRSLQKRLIWLLANGKNIEIIVGDKTANDFYAPPEEHFTLASALPYLYEKNLRRFAKYFDHYLQNGQLKIRIWKDGSNSYHLKGVWVDNRYILLTGNNLNPRAWGLDAENAILISDPKADLSEKVNKELNQIRVHTQLLTHYSDLEQLKDYPDKVKRLLKKFGRVKLDKIVKMLL